ALQRGAQVVITGRVTDTGLTLGPLMHAFGWAPDGWDRIAAGTVAGHIIECGAQCSGGNCLRDWERIPDLANVGYPIVEARAHGYKAVGARVYAWPDALDTAKAADRILRERLCNLCLEFEAIRGEFVGADATHGPLALKDVNVATIPEVQLRVGVRARDEAPVDRFTREIAPLIRNGPPSVTGFAGGRPKPEEILAYSPALIDKRMV